MKKICTGDNMQRESIQPYWSYESWFITHYKFLVQNLSRTVSKHYIWNSKIIRGGLHLQLQSSTALYTRWRCLLSQMYNKTSPAKHPPAQHTLDTWIPLRCGWHCNIISLKDLWICIMRTSFTCVPLVYHCVNTRYRHRKLLQDRTSSKTLHLQFFSTDGAETSKTLKGCCGLSRLLSASRHKPLLPGSDLSMTDVKTPTAQPWHHLLACT